MQKEYTLLQNDGEKECAADYGSLLACFHLRLVSVFFYRSIPT